MKGRIIVPRMVSDAKRKTFFYLHENAKPKVSAAKRKKLELVGADLLLHGNDCVETEMHGRCSTIYDRLGLLEKEQVG